MKTYGIIYKAKNLINGKSYIGKTVMSLEKRQSLHIRDARYSTKDFIFLRAIRKYGYNSFKWEIIEFCDNNKTQLDEMEYHYIMQYRTYIGFNDCNGYNMTLGGEGAPGAIRTEETKQRIRMARLKQVPPMLGKKFSDAHKQKLRESHLGILNHLYGKEPWNKGKNRTEETKQKISESLKGRVVWNKGIKTNIRPWLGKHRTEETKQKISESLIKKKNQ